MELIKKGKKNIVGLIVVFIMIDIITIAVCTYIYGINGYMDQVISQLLRGAFRLILECTILFFLYKGRVWAKNLMTILLIVGGIFSLTTLSIWVMAAGIIYIAFAIILIKSKSVNSFLSFQKNGFNELDKGTILEKASSEY